MTIDMEAASNEIAEGLGLDIKTDDTADIPDTPDTPDAPDALAEGAEAGAAPVVQAAPRPAPKSWAKEQHEHWGKLDPKVQEYIELREKQFHDGVEQYKGDAGFGRSMREAVTPYKAILASQGVDEVKATQYLLNAHYKLSTLGGEQKIAYLAQIARSYGIELPGYGQQQREIDPAVREAQERLARLEGKLTEREQRAYDEAKARTSSEVGAFADAKDDKGQPKHPYFEEVADDIIVFLNHGLPLEEAYDRAVHANPATRAKEHARLKSEAEASLKQRAKQEGTAARAASSSNVRSRDTRKAPTEPLGKMDDTLKETLRDIKSRAH
jgi:hypothetical protein